jgi:hypothetical protein
MLQTRQVIIYYLGALFYIICICLKNCSSILDNNDLRVPIGNVTHKICTSARCVKVENSRVKRYRHI